MERNFPVIPIFRKRGCTQKRIPKFSKTFPGIFTVPFNFGPEISEFLAEWKAPLVRYTQIFEKFFLEISVPFDFHPVISGIFG